MLLEAVRDDNTHVILASSAAIYGHPEWAPIIEDDPKEPTSSYGLEKLTIDHYADVYCDLYDLKTVALRYFNIYGSRQIADDYSSVISISIHQALSGEELRLWGWWTDAASRFRKSTWWDDRPPSDTSNSSEFGDVVVQLQRLLDELTLVLEVLPVLDVPRYARLSTSDASPTVARSSSGRSTPETETEVIQ